MRLIIAALTILALTGCASSGFNVATQANTSRADAFQENILLQADNDLMAINDCYLRASGYARVGGSNAVHKVGEPSDPASCTVMATALRTQSNMMTMFAPFVAKELFQRVPAAPEEIIQSIIKDGMKFALMKFGIEQVSNVVTTGQLAAFQAAQTATQQSGEIVNKVLDKPATILTIPEGGSAAILK